MKFGIAIVSGAGILAAMLAAHVALSISMLSGVSVAAIIVSVAVFRDHH